MNKTELIAAVAEKAELSKKDAVVEEVAKGEKIQLVGFGTFERKERKEREGCNPQTGAKIPIPASMVPAFKVGKAFKDAVNK